MATLTRDGSFFIGDDWGDATDGLTGLFLAETRHLSRWRLTIGDATPLLLSRDSDGSSATIVAAEATTRGRPPVYEAQRVQAVHTGGLAEDVIITSHSKSPLRVVVRYDVGADFADQFELRGDKTYPRRTCRSVTATDDGLRFDYQRDWYHRSSWITASPPPDIDSETGVLGWTADIAAGDMWRVTLSVTAAPQPTPPTAVRVARDGADDVRAFLAPALARLSDQSTPLAVPLATAAHADTDRRALDAAVRQGLRDIAELRIRLPDQPHLRPVGAGVPWFLTLFGRDSLITSYMAMPYLPDLAADTLRALAAVQGTTHDPDRVEEPGKIVHEVRAGELSVFGDVPYRRYYGTVDATPLFLIVLGRHRDMVGDALARELEPAARAAVGWMRADGGLDEHGYLVYRTDRPGLVNQCWKDSPDSICFPDGRPATGPIAVCEAQGYAYDALRTVARLARDVWSDTGYATELDEAAARLRDRFGADFWCDSTNFPALALDGSGSQVATIASNPAHLLWSGIFDRDRATRVARRLMQPDLFSGWGLRTLAAHQDAYHPISYHRGGVWPHDTALAVAGLARVGDMDAAARLASGLIDAAAAAGGRLPELITGHDRAGHRGPVRYPHACSPQAWAAASPLLLAQTLA